MAKDKPNKLPFTLFLISLSLHLIVFAASSHEYVWSKPVKPSQPIKFRVVSVEKPEEKLPLNPRSRFLSNANRKESGAGKPGKTPRLRREDRDLIPSRRGVVSPEIASLAPVPKPKVPPRAALPVSPKPPAVVTPKPELEREEKKQEKKSPETSEITETPQPTETASLAPTPKPSVKTPSPAIQEKTKPKPKAKPKARTNPEKKRREIKTLPKKKPEPKPVVKKKAVKKVVKKKVAKKKPRKENKKVEAKKQTKEKVELAALKPVARPIRPRPPAPKRPQSKDPLALFRVKPQPRGKPELPKFDLSDEAADRIAKKSLSDKKLEREEGEAISLDTRDFRYASYFAHIKRRIQNAWIWPAEARKNRGELLLRFKLRKNGTLEDVRLIRSAGVRILDDLAMAAVTKAAPFNPFPEGLERKSITATFVYE